MQLSIFFEHVEHTVIAAILADKAREALRGFLWGRIGYAFKPLVFLRTGDGQSAAIELNFHAVAQQSGDNHL